MRCCPACPSKQIRISEMRLTEAGNTEPAIRAWSMAYQAIFSSSRFQFLD
jgi:hypothetical protein